MNLPCFRFTIEKGYEITNIYVHFSMYAYSMSEKNPYIHTHGHANNFIYKQWQNM